MLRGCGKARSPAERELVPGTGISTFLALDAGYLLGAMEL